MSTDFRTARREDRIADRDADRADRQAEMAAKLQLAEIQAKAKLEAENQRAEQARIDADADRKRKAADRKAADEAARRRKEERTAVRARRIAWLKANPATLFVALVMACSVVPAVLSQVAALTEAGVLAPLAALLAAMMEGGAWAITFMGKQAEDQGKPVGKYRIGTWSTALLAGAINFWHGSTRYPLWVAAVLGASSVFAVWIWDMKVHGSHGRTRAERRRVKDAKEHEEKRRKHHKDLAELADRLQSAARFGTLDAEAAFERAWGIVHGGETGMTVELRSIETAARHQILTELEEEFGTGDEVFTETVEALREGNRAGSATIRAARARALRSRARALTGAPDSEPANMPASQRASMPTDAPQVPAHSARKPQVGTNVPPLSRGPQRAAEAGRPKQVRAARTLAADTARAATPEQMEKEKEEAREWIRAQAARPSWKAVSDQTGRGETWCRGRLREVDAESAAPGLHLVAGGE
jgi:hypothetical protein